ncbi:hypothetical protein HA48_19550 [Pantoea wallisii]|uniref:Uncharacterized protein n=1 Tax=Pantoea wallisii TaxID=1076551 RepID=A0A1X1CY00_9GAMM|nr:DUF943 family protein [Pantoea wallisii]ORM69181.1 hypothetical protein HA48_19550 [Pantoea wallisii]
MKKRLFIMFSITVGICAAYVWLNHRDVRIINAVRDSSVAVIVVENFPISDSARIKWWLTNKALLSDKFNIPAEEKGGPDHFVIYDFGDGYREEGSRDRYCLSNVPSPVNCVDKNTLMVVDRNRKGERSFLIGNTVYLQNNKDKSVVRSKGENKNEN